MKQQLFAALENLANNDQNEVVYRDRGRARKAWSELAGDIDRAIARLASLRPDRRDFQVGLIGPATYEWMVLDLACLKAGFRSIAVPEFLTGREIGVLFQEAQADVVLADRAVAERLSEVDVPVWFFGSGPGAAAGFHELKVEGSVCVTSFDGKRIAAIAHRPAERGGLAELKSYLAARNPQLADQRCSCAARCRSPRRTAC
jgi:hypothetical protein